MAPSTKLIAEAGQRLGITVETFGERLAHIRRKRNLSVKSFAAQCRVLPIEVTAWERMKDADCTGTQLAIICIGLRASMIWLALGIGHQEPSVDARLRKVQLLPM